MVQFFQQLFLKEANPNRNNFLSSGFPSMEPNLMSATFEKVTGVDIKKVVLDMGAIKALNVDGLPAGFFQKHCEIVKFGVINCGYT